jgi:hypothetical protein
LDREGRTIWTADAHRDDGKRFVMHADEELTAFLELQRAIHEFAVSLCITSLLSEIALCSSVSITTAAKVPIRAIPMDERIANAIRSCSSL